MQRSGIVSGDDCVLSVPIFNNESKVIGVAQLVKTKGQKFTDVDISTLEVKFTVLNKTTKSKSRIE
jgi:hypothetical protein